MANKSRVSRKQQSKDLAKKCAPEAGTAGPSRAADAGLSLAGTTGAAAMMTAAAVAVVTALATAGCGVFQSPSAPSGMQKQIVQGERVGAASRANAPRSGAGAAAAPTPAEPVPGQDVTAIGDSVMSASAMALASALPGIYIDAKPDRQMPAGLDIVRSLAESGRLRPVVVMGLGTNYIVTTAQLQELMQLIGPHRKLVLINTYVPDGWSKQVNATEAAFIRQHPQITLADWFDTIRNRLYLLWPDRVHPEIPGTLVYARMVYRAVQATRGVPGSAPPPQPAVAQRAAAASPPARQHAGT
jgi:hypothetical protein